MTAPNREQFKNTAQTTLDEVGGINNSVTSFDVDDGSVFPAVGNFRILLDSEIMLVTARSADTLTVVRGQEGTAAASHSDDVNCTHILTQGALDRGGKDNVANWGSSAPPLNKLVAADGITPLTSASFTWTNQGTGSVVDDSAGTITLRAPASASNDLRILTVAAPSAPWTLIAAVQLLALVDDAGNCAPQLGVVLRESGTGKLISFGMNRATSGNKSQRFAIDRWTNPTTYAGSTPFQITNPIFTANVIWFRVVDNNTNLIFSLSIDGENFIEVLSESRTAHMAGAPNQIGIVANNAGNSSAKDSLVKLLHFHTE